MLRKLALSLALVACAAMPLCGVAEASIADSPFTPASQMNTIVPIEKVQFIHRRNRLLLVSQRLAGSGLLPVRLGVAHRLGLGRRLGLEQLGWRLELRVERPGLAPWHAAARE